MHVCCAGYLRGYAASLSEPGPERQPARRAFACCTRISCCSPTRSEEDFLWSFPPAMRVHAQPAWSVAGQSNRPCNEWQASYKLCAFFSPSPAADSKRHKVVATCVQVVNRAANSRCLRLTNPASSGSLGTPPGFSRPPSPTHNACCASHDGLAPRVWHTPSHRPEPPEAMTSPQMLAADGLRG